MKRHLICALALAACQPAADPRFLGPPVPSPGVDACGAAELADMVGEPKSILQTMKFAVPLRIIEPGMPITSDLRQDRLNVEIAADGTIARIACY